MHSTDSRPTRILAQPGIDFIERLESELERNIIIVSGDGNWGAAEEHAKRGQEKFPDVENPLCVVFNSTLSGAADTGGFWAYMSQFPEGQGFVLDDDGERYYPTGEFMGLRQPGDHVAFTITLDSDQEYVFAEATANVVSMGFSLQQASGSIAHDNLNWERVLGEPIRLAASDDIAVRAEELRIERRRRAFEQFVSQGRDRALNQLRRRITESEQNILGNQQQLTENLQNLNNYGKQVAALEATLSEDSGTWQTRFDELCSHPRLTDVEFANGGFVLTTDHLRLTSPDTGESRWLGRFKITVPLGGSNGYSISFDNLDNAKGGRPHPHVAHDGPCFGAISATVAQLHADLELMALADVLVMFLESFNSKDDWGSYAAYWFGVDDEDPRAEFNSNVVIEAPADAEMAVA